MTKTFAILMMAVIISASLTACGKKKAVVNMAAVDAGVTAVNDQFPMHLGVDLTLTKASVVGDHVQFDYSSPYPSKVQVPPRATGLMRGSMVQYACGNPAARSILNAGANIDHRVIDIEGRELFATVGDLAVCDLYK